MDMLLTCATIGGMIVNGICVPPRPPEPEQHYVTDMRSCVEAFNGFPRSCYIWPVPRELEGKK